jgi:hypothetical protein
MAPPSRNLASRPDTSRVSASTIEPKFHISRFAGDNAKLQRFLALHATVDNAFYLERT